MSVFPASFGVLHMGTDEVSYNSPLKFLKFKLNWAIPDFEFACKNMKSLESPKFSSLESKKVKWYLRFEPVELKHDNNEIFKIYLKSTMDVTKYLACTVSVLNSSGNGPNFNYDFTKISCSLGWTKSGSAFYQELQIDKSLSKNVTVTCELTVFDSAINSIEKPLRNSLQSENLLEQIESSFDDQSFKDVTFQVEEKEFSAHKLILALRSPVFAAMFRNKMSEELTSTVEISDMKATIFHEMLRFIYTDEIENLEESAFEMFYAAEKYELEKLRNMCINSLYKSLSLETVIKTLDLADLFSVFDLKEKSLKYLILNLEAVKERKEFGELMERRLHLSTEMVKMQKTINYENQANIVYSEDMTFEFRT